MVTFPVAPPGRERLAPSRVISIPLSEDDWRAFVATHPEPVQWLRQQISEAIGGSRGEPGEGRLVGCEA